MTRRTEAPSAPVPQAQQAEAVRSRWSWAEPGVWTDRMLTALERGVQGGKWFRLFDKVFSERNLEAAFRRVARNDGAPGVDHVTTAAFERQMPEAIRGLSEQIRRGAYRPQAIRRVHIGKPGTTETRPLGIPTVRDRVVQRAVLHVVEPIFERTFAEHSYGFRPGRSCRDALRRVDALLKAGYIHVVDADLKSYFDSIPHDRLLDRLQERIADGPVLRLIEAFLKADILEGLASWTPEAGAPQGAVLSPVLSNVYLDGLDHRAAEGGFQMVRYADDFVILCRTAHEAQAALELVQSWVSENALTLHPTKTRVVDVGVDGFDFLGYHFATRRGRLGRWVRTKAQQKLKDAVRAQTKRGSGRAFHRIIASVNRTLRGWFVYFQHSRPWVFGRLDQFVRQRLRAILRRRRKRRGCAKGWDFHRWPNAFFAARGLFGLMAAHAALRQPSRR